MPTTPLGYLPADLAQVRAAPEFKRFNFFGLRFGSSRVRDLRLAVSEDGLRLQAEVRLGKKTWVKVPAAMVDAMAERRFALDTDRAIQASLSAPLAVRPLAPEVDVGAGLRRPRADSAPLPAGPGLQRSNAIRRTVSAPQVTEVLDAEVKLPRSPAQRPAVFRAPSMASFVGEVGVWDDESATTASPGSPASASHVSVASTPATSLAASVEMSDALPATVRAYCDKMAASGEYGRELEVRALAEVMGRPIYVVQEYFASREGHDPELVRVMDEAAGGRASVYQLTQAAEPSRPVAGAEPIVLLLEGGGHGADRDTSGNHYVPMNTNDPAGPWLPTRVNGLRGKALGNGDCLFYAVSQRLPAYAGANGAAAYGALDLQAKAALAAQLRAQAVHVLRNKGAELTLDNDPAGNTLHSQMADAGLTHLNDWV